VHPTVKTAHLQMLALSVLRIMVSITVLVRSAPLANTQQAILTASTVSLTAPTAKTTSPVTSAALDKHSTRVSVLLS
jgi:hypothetical protein